MRSFVRRQLSEYRRGFVDRCSCCKHRIWLSSFKKRKYKVFNCRWCGCWLDWIAIARLDNDVDTDDDEV